MESKYQFYEVVRVAPSFAGPQHVVGLEGAVLGMAQDEVGRWSYGVYLYKLERVWSFSQEDLEVTGVMDRRESFYDGPVITVVVDPWTGKGRITDK